MIIQSLCNTCLQPFQLLLQPSDLELVKSISESDGRLAPCPRLCGGKINLVGDALIEQMGADRRLKEPLHLTGKELYQAVNGMGLPDEFPQDEDALQLLFRKASVVGVRLEKVGKKIYLHEIDLGIGTIHLTAGPRGALILKVTKGH